MIPHQKQMEKEILEGRGDPDDPSTQKILKLDPRFIDGYHGIANSEHLNLTEEQFISFVDELSEEGQFRVVIGNQTSGEL